MSVGPMALNVVWPSARVPDVASNEASVVLVVENGSSSALLTGDAESDVLDVIADRGALPDVDVLKVGHHGSVGAVDETALDALRPERAVISVGAGNRFGHPRPETLAILQSRGIAIERTDEEGDVVMMPP
ncbi:MAG: hypothetical protein HY876_11030 [Coriobacteriales bacterium]|nr:hypothetical protein [Coriobacteriales bacterium]